MNIYIAGQLLIPLEHFENEDEIKINVTLKPLGENYTTILQLNVSVFYNNFKENLCLYFIGSKI